MLPIWLLAAMMIKMYYWRFWEPWANAMLAILLPKFWFGLKIMTGTTVFACLPGAHSALLDPKKLQNEQFYIIDWIRKKLLVDVANLAPCCHDDYDVLLEVLGTLGKCYVSNPVAKTLVWIENHDWHNCFCMSSWGSPLLDPKKLQNEQFYIIDWTRKKLLVDVANLAPCCHDDYDVLLEVLGNPGQMLCYQSCCQNSGLDWKSWLAQLFLHVFLRLTLTGPKKASKRTVLHNRLNKEKAPGRCCQSGSLLPWWLWCTIGGFGNPGQMLC